ncbi:DUF6194 family protein, partial [Leptolyngbya sp. FACHB-36]|uniref:DUF6194 family protein n=1 Tax=Leptolyngbya sp. FACHB-36 TaxID=2692808 RepID=UPI001F55762C
MKRQLQTWQLRGLLCLQAGRVLPNGVYFCTIKQHNSENDQASNLDREEVFRVAIGLHPKTYVRLFGQKPVRPS